MGAVLPVHPEPCQLGLGDDGAIIAIGEPKQATFLFVRVQIPANLNRAINQLCQ
jgi:hypothetical protein